MINEIMEAIRASLKEEFGDNYEIDMEEVRQGSKTPCFFIQCLNSTNDLFLGKRYFRTNRFCIQYFPQSEEVKTECSDVGKRMWQCIEYITLSGDDKPVRGTQMKCEVIDGVLHFFVNYDCFVQKTEQTTLMGSLESNMNVKGGD